MTVKDTDNLAGAVSGKTTLADMSADQLQYFGGELDPDLDAADLDSLDRGDDLVSVAGKVEDESEESEVTPEDESEESEVTPEDESEESEATPEDESEESEVTPEDESEESDDKAKQPAKDNRIPKQRFDEVNARRKAAEDRVAQLEAEAKAKDQGTKFDFQAAESEYIDLVLDGKKDEALAKRREIDTAKETAWRSAARADADVTVDSKEENRSTLKVVADLESQYAEFRPGEDNEAYSEDLVEETMAMAAGYMSHMGLKKADALKLAAENVVRIYGLKRVGDASATEPNKGTTTKKAPKKDTAKKVETAKKAPKDLGAAGTAGDSAGTSAVKIEDLSDEELMALPESTLARMRGDVI